MVVLDFALQRYSRHEILRLVNSDGTPQHLYFMVVQLF